MPSFRAKLALSILDNSFKIVKLAISYLVLELCSKILYDPGNTRFSPKMLRIMFRVIDTLISR